MDADWEVEIGGGAPVIEAEWPGFVDLRSYPERVSEIAEAAACSPLTALLLAMNAATSPLWTSKCDVWEPEPGALACYIDMLPVEGRVFADWKRAEAFCRQYVTRLNSKRSGGPGSGSERASEDSITLVVRQAVAGKAEGFGITTYLTAKAVDPGDAVAVLRCVMATFANALPLAMPPATGGSTLK